MGDYLSTKNHMASCLERKRRNLSPSQVDNLKVLVSHPLIDEERTEHIEKHSEKEERREIRKFIEGHYSILNLCPYCKHRSSVDYEYDVKKHMKICSKRRKDDSKPIKISSIEEFLTKPPPAGSPYSHMNEKQFEDLKV